jgi:hypothetical protein
MFLYWVLHSQCYFQLKIFCLVSFPIYVIGPISFSGVVGLCHCFILVFDQLNVFLIMFNYLSFVSLNTGYMLNLLSKQLILDILSSCG